MPTYYDLTNYVITIGPDSLRGEIGYYRSADNLINQSNDTIKSFTLSSVNVNTDQVFPSFSQQIQIYGDESVINNQDQWKTTVDSLVNTDQSYLDHTFSLYVEDKQTSFFKNFHHPEYEDLSKDVDTNLLLNYNIFTAKHKRASQASMAAVQTTYESGPALNFESANYLSSLFDNYSNRLNNLLFPLAEKNKNIFLINKEKIHAGVQFVMQGVTTSFITELISYQQFPYCMVASLNTAGSYVNGGSLSLLEAFEKHHLTKYLLQAIKNNQATSTVNLWADGESISVKAHDLSNLITSLSYGNFFQDIEETYFLSEADSQDGFFTDQVAAVELLNDINSIIEQHGRDYEQIINSEDSKIFNLCYKIEKYLDNDATSPVQTYYIKNDSKLLDFIDTQMKYGRKYIYKIFDVCCVLGSTYEYTNYEIQQGVNQQATSNAGEFVPLGSTIVNAPSRGIPPQTLTGGRQARSSRRSPVNLSKMGPIGAPIPLQVATSGGNTSNVPINFNSNETYAAVIDVEIRPSLQILEVPIFDFEKMFFDQIPPDVVAQFSAFNDSVKINMSPTVHERIGTTFFPLHPDEGQIVENLVLSSDGFMESVNSKKYFNGEYLIYRLDRKPEKKSEFYDSFLTSVKMPFELHETGKDTNDDTRKVTRANLMNVSFRDYIVPNKKYYYLFRTASYHGTPSNPGDIYEVELLKTAADVEVVVNVLQYNTPTDEDWGNDFLEGEMIDNYTKTKMSKRIVKITPNLDQLDFDDEIDNIQDILNDQQGGVGILEKKLFTENGNKFKIRITSKHTGKKIDLNLNFKIIKKLFN